MRGHRVPSPPVDDLQADASSTFCLENITRQVLAGKCGCTPAMRRLLAQIAVQVQAAQAPGVQRYPFHMGRSEKQLYLKHKLAKESVRYRKKINIKGHDDVLETLHKKSTTKCRCGHKMQRSQPIPHIRM